MRIGFDTCHGGSVKATVVPSKSSLGNLIPFIRQNFYFLGPLYFMGSNEVDARASVSSIGVHWEGQMHFL